MAAKKAHAKKGATWAAPFSAPAAGPTGEQKPAVKLLGLSRPISRSR